MGSVATGDAGVAVQRYIVEYDKIKQAIGLMKPAARKALVDYIEANSHYALDTVLAWSLCYLHYLGPSGGKVLAGSWTLAEKPAWMSQSSWQATLEGPSGGPVAAKRRQGITTNQMRGLVGLPPVRELKPIARTKSNPQGLRSRSAGSSSLGEVTSRKPKPKARRK